MGFNVASRVRGLSDGAIRKAFGTEEQFRAALLPLRWPDGFICPCCGHRGHCVLAGRGLYQCNRRKKQTSPTAGTIFHSTKLPVTLWFAAIHPIVTAKNGVSSVEAGGVVRVRRTIAALDEGRVGGTEADPRPSVAGRVAVAAKVVEAPDDDAVAIALAIGLRWKFVVFSPLYA